LKVLRTVLKRVSPRTVLFCGTIYNMNPNPIISDTVLGSKYFNPDYLFNQALSFFRALFESTSNISTEIISLYNTILLFLALFFLTIIFYSSIRLLEIRKKEHKHLEHEITEYAHHQAEKEKKLREGEEVSKNPRWLKTLSYLFSQHESDWKLAVIEADSMLEGLMDQMGFKEENLGEKLKGATQESFHGLTSAWEVHTIRNKIAHDGAAFTLTQREAKRIIALYEQIFREYGYI